MSSWHTLACVRRITRHVWAWQRSFCRWGFDLTGWQRCKWSFPARFFLFFFFGFMKAKGWQAKVAKAFSAVNVDVWSIFGWIEGLVIDRCVWVSWQSTSKQIDKGEVNMFEIFGGPLRMRNLLMWWAQHQTASILACASQHGHINTLSNSPETMRKSRFDLNLLITN